MENAFIMTHIHLHIISGCSQLSSPSPQTDLAGIEGYWFKSSSCFSLNENDLIIKILSDNKKSDNNL